MSKAQPDTAAQAWRRVSSRRRRALLSYLADEAAQAERWAEVAPGVERREALAEATALRAAIALLTEGGTS